MLARILLFVHVMCSIGLFAWAYGIYSNRIQWTSASKESPGVIDRSKDKIDDANRAIDKAFYRWSGSLQDVAKLELERYPRRDFYVGQLNLVQYGSLTPGGPKAPGRPVQELVIDPRNGYLDISRPTGRNPIQVRPLVAADSFVGYEASMAKLVQDIDASRSRSDKALADRKKLNEEIIGLTEPMLVKGLRLKINEQKRIEDNARDEEAYVNNQLTNREAEYGLLKKRFDAIQARKKELQK